MIYFRCKLCGKQKAVSQIPDYCPKCKSPIDAAGTTGDISVGQRIDEYKANGYKIYILDGNTVKMYKDGFTRYFRIYFAAGVSLFVSIACWATLLRNTVIPLPALSLLLAIIGMAIACQSLSVSITLTHSGMIEEKGNICNTGTES